MAGLIKDEDIQLVRERVRIDEVVEQYVTLRNAGGGSRKGLCPFHDEKTPSFNVSSARGTFHCFGCGEGGDAIAFVQKIEGLTFREAMERLASKVGIQLREEEGAPVGPRRDPRQRQRLLEAHRLAGEFYAQTLASAPEAQPGRQFVTDRGFDQSVAETYGMGWAPRSGTALTALLRGKGFSEEELVVGGLARRSSRGLFDVFQGRLLWPIREMTSEIIGFGARRMFEDDFMSGKYVNTAETPIYKKSQVLYGIDAARRQISSSSQAVVVEGYTDVMACHLAGVTTAVATCGTAFGADHITIIRRVMGDIDNRDSHQLGEVVFTFDPDEAGQKAASRAFADEQRFAAQTYVAVAPDGLDPCDLRLKRGDDAVRMLIQSRKPMYEFMVRRQLDALDLETVEGRVAALRATAPIVAGIRDESLSIGYTRTLAGWIGMDPTEVAQAVRAARRAPARGPSTASAGRGQQGGGETAPGSAPIAAGDSAAAMAAESVPTIGIAQLPTDPVTRLERELLMALLQHPGEIPIETAKRALHTTFTQPALATVRDAVLAALDAYATPDWARRVAEEAPPAFSPLVTQLAIAPLPMRDGRTAEYCAGVTTSLIDRDLLRRKTELLGALQRTDAADDPERHRALQQQLVEVEAERRKVRGD